jgi:hypothetical protein
MLGQRQEGDDGVRAEQAAANSPGASAGCRDDATSPRGRDVEDAFAQQPVAQLPWGDITVLLDKLDGPELGDWYASQAITYGWSRAVLDHHIKALADTRFGTAPTRRRPLGRPSPTLSAPLTAGRVIHSWPPSLPLDVNSCAEIRAGFGSHRVFMSDLVPRAGRPSIRVLHTLGHRARPRTRLAVLACGQP